MQDLKDTKLMYLKGGLFLVIGMVAASLLFMETPTLRIGVLLALAIWGFCRAYYFAFYVIERYIDPSYRFSGLVSFIAYVLRKRSGS